MLERLEALMGAATPRPWGDDWGVNWEPWRIEGEDRSLAVVAVNCLPTLIEAARAAAEFRRVAVTGEGHSLAPGLRLDAALSALREENP